VSEFNQNDRREVTLKGGQVDLVHAAFAKYVEDVNHTYQSAFGIEMPARPTNAPQATGFRETLQAESINADVIETARDIVGYGVQRENGQIVEVDIDKFPADHMIHAHAKPVVRNDRGELEFAQEVSNDSSTSMYQLPQRKYSPEVSGVNNSSSRQERRFGRPSRKQLAIGGAVTALLAGGVGGGAVTNGYGTGMTIPGLSHDQNGSEAAIADAPIVAEPATTETAATPSPELKLNAGDIILGDCLSDDGQGKSSVSADVGLGADQNYKLKKLNGEEELLQNEGKKPKVEIPEAKINVAACIPAENRKDAVTVDGNKVKINWEKIDRQLGIVPSGKSPTVEAWDMYEEPGVTDRATVAALVAAMGDPANQSAAINIVRAEFGKKVIAESEPAIQAKLTEAIKKDVEGQAAALKAAKKAPEVEVIVEFTNSPNPLGYKGPTQAPVSAFEVVNVAMNDNDADPKTPPVITFK
jgi:hypothetical protein